MFKSYYCEWQSSCRGEMLRSIFKWKCKGVSKTKNKLQQRFFDCINFESTMYAVCLIRVSTVWLKEQVIRATINIV